MIEKIPKQGRGDLNNREPQDLILLILNQLLEWGPRCKTVTGKMKFTGVIIFYPA
jgi:hypothetical protein